MPAELRMVEVPPTSTLAMVPRFLAELVRPSSLVKLLILAVASAALNLVICLGGVMSWGLLGAYFFTVQFLAMHGEYELPDVRRMGAGDMLANGFRVIGLSLLFVLPAGVWAYRAIRVTAVTGEPAGLMSAPLLLAYLGLLCFLLPSLLIGAGTAPSFAQVLSPRRVLAPILAIPGPYVGTWLLLAAAMAGGTYASVKIMLAISLGPAQTGLPLYLVAVFVSRSVYLLFVVLSAQILGWMVYSHAPQLGIGVSWPQTPAEPQARPRGTAPEPADASGASGARDPEPDEGLPAPPGWDGSWSSAPPRSAGGKAPEAPAGPPPGVGLALGAGVPPRSPEPPPAPVASPVHDEGWLRPASGGADSLLSGYGEQVAVLSDEGGQDGFGADAPGPGDLGGESGGFDAFEPLSGPSPFDLMAPPEGLDDADPAPAAGPDPAALAPGLGWDAGPHVLASGPALAPVGPTFEAPLGLGGSGSALPPSGPAAPPPRTASNEAAFDDDGFFVTGPSPLPPPGPLGAAPSPRAAPVPASGPPPSGTPPSPPKADVPAPKPAEPVTPWGDPSVAPWEK